MWSKTTYALSRRQGCHYDIPRQRACTVNYAGYDCQYPLNLCGRSILAFPVKVRISWRWKYVGAANISASAAEHTMKSEQVKKIDFIPLYSLLRLTKITIPEHARTRIVR